VSIDIFFFDLDGTVTREEVLPRIATAFGVGHQIAQLTKRTIQGDIPFEASLRERVKILGALPVDAVSAVVADVELEPAIIDFIGRNSARCRIITGNLDAWLAKLAPRIPAQILSSRVSIVDNRVDAFLEIMDKSAAIEKFSGARICAIGEGHNDLGMFERADVSVAYGGVHQPASSLFDVATHVAYDPVTLCQFLSQL
jgi:phosphoserine phosphatase